LRWRGTIGHRALQVLEPEHHYFDVSRTRGQSQKLGAPIRVRHGHLRDASGPGCHLRARDWTARRSNDPRQRLPVRPHRGGSQKQ
jgi:hypothetical protein